MGCDIHAHLEVKIEGIWHHYSTPNIRRNYNLFAKMAGVRNYTEGPDAIVPISNPKGLPEQMSFITWFDYKMRWESDGHSMSWLDGDELDYLESWFDSQQQKDEIFAFSRMFGYLFGNGFNVKKYPSDYPKGVEDARLVFWFDN